jgi:hypothetical protein
MTDTQLALMPAAAGRDHDPHAAARQQVRDAIAVTAVLHGGTVSANAVRIRLAGYDVPSQIVGQVYRELRREGRLVEDGVERSTDTAGGNAGRWIPVYRWVDAP